MNFLAGPSTEMKRNPMTANTVCPFPINSDRVCGRTVLQRSGPGRPRIYCDDTKHNAVARLRADQRFRARAQQNPDGKPERPTTERVSALAATLDRLGDLKAELLAELADAEELAADIADLDLVAAEMRAVEAAADARVAQARAAQAAAERDAAQARRERDEALELSEVALDAAEEAIEARDAAAEAVTRMREDCDRQLSRETAGYDAELGRVRSERDRCQAVADKALNELREQSAELAAVREDHRQLVAALTGRVSTPAETRGRPMPRVGAAPAKQRRRTIRAA